MEGGEADELEADRLALALVDDVGEEGAADGVVEDAGLEVDPVVDRLLVDGDDHVARFETGGLGRAFGVDLADERAATLVGVVDVEAEPGVLDEARIEHPVDDLADAAHGNGEADAGAAIVDRDVDADDLTVDVEQRAAGVAGIDDGAGLDEVAEVLLAAQGDLAGGGRDDARGDGAAETEGVADRDHRLAEHDVTGAAELGGREALVRDDLEDGDVVLLVGADETGLVLATVEEADRDAVGAADDVVVRDHVALLVDDHAGAEREVAQRAAALLGLGVLEEVAEHAASADELLRVDVDDAGIHLLDRDDDRTAPTLAGGGGLVLGREARGQSDEESHDEKGVDRAHGLSGLHFAPLSPLLGCSSFAYERGGVLAPESID